VANDDDAPEARPVRRRRVLLVVLAAIVVAVFALRAALAFFAADLFALAVRQAASRSGLEIVLDSAPEVTSGGFKVLGVTVRSAGGEEWLRAGEAFGSTRFFLRTPYLGVSLTLIGARATWKSNAGEPFSFEVPELPPVLSRVELADARIDLGNGRTISMDALVEPEGKGGLAIKATRLDYSEPSGEHAVEKVRGSLLLEPVLSDDATARALRLEFVADSGAALADTVLLDFAAHPLTVSGIAGPGRAGGLRASELAAAFGKLVSASGRVDLDAKWSIEAADLSVKSDDLQPAFVTLVREPFAGVVPALADSVLEGRGNVTLRLGKASRHQADATISLTSKSLRTRSVEAESLVVELPWIGAALSGRASRSGRVRAAGLTILGLPWTGIDATVSAEPGRLRAKADQQWKAAGGTLRIRGLVLEDSAREGPRLSANLVLEDFDLAKLGEIYGIGWLRGKLRGDLGRVRIDEDAIRTEGTLDVETFGGSMRVSKLVVEQPFGRVPEIGLDAKLDGMDLGAMTEQLGYGRVSGVLEGQVSNLVIAAGQPQSFDADLHTVKRSGVSQTVDVRAIVQLGVLGGGDSGSLTGTFLKVVDRYRYSKLGLRCRLRNDVFEIRGVESDGGKDYIVKGSLLPPSVSVVSHSQVVSFSEMLRRIQRINAIDEGGSPNVPSP